MKYPRRFKFAPGWRGFGRGAPYSLKWYEIVSVDQYEKSYHFINDAGREDGIGFNFTPVIFQYDNDIIDALLEKYA